MGTLTDANIGFGIEMEEGCEFPWDEEGDWDGCYILWWEYINNYENPYDWNTKEYYQFKKEWDEKNPIPFSLENCCSRECAIYVLCVAETVKCASRGYPEYFNPHELEVNPDLLIKFKEFIKKYEISDDEPKWLLFSYWG